MHLCRSPHAPLTIMTGAFVALVLAALPASPSVSFAAPANKLAATEAASTIRYLKSDQSLRTKPEMGSLASIQLRKGAEVKWLRNDGLFAFVESRSGSKGYILNLLLSQTPPLSQSAGEKALENLSAAQQTRMRPRTTAATMGVRGLSSDKALRQQFPPDVDALRQIEACRAPQSLVDQLSSELPL